MKKLITISITIVVAVVFSLIIFSIVKRPELRTSHIEFSSTSNLYFIHAHYDWGEDEVIYLAPNTTYNEALSVYLDFLKNK